MTRQTWPGLEFRHLTALRAVVERGSFHGAAQALGYTQSAISQQVARLEEIVGQRLVERRNGPVRLTEAGRSLLEHADVISARLKLAESELEALEGSPGRLRLGVFQSVSSRILPDIVGRLTERWPRLEIELTEAAADVELLQLLGRGALDLTFAHMPLPDGPFEAVELMRDEYVLLMPTEPRFPRPDRVTLDDLGEIPLIGYRQCRSAEQVIGQLRARGVVPRFVFRADDNATVQAMVRAGFGAALVPRLAVNEEDRGVVVVELAEPRPYRTVALASLSHQRAAPTARAFVEAARAWADRRPSGPAPASTCRPSASSMRPARRSAARART